MYRPTYAGVDRHCDSEDQSQCGVGLRAWKSENARQPQNACTCSRKHTFGRTRSRKSNTSDPFHLSSILGSPQTSSLRMHSIGLSCARRPDLEDLLHQLVWVVHSTTTLLDMSDGKRRTREVMEGDEERKAGSRLRKTFGSGRSVAVPASIVHSTTVVISKQPV